ncbi:17277_t:CDS:2, partial [Funneliformis geosporum]
MSEEPIEKSNPKLMDNKKDENGQTEKGREVAKQKDYYNQAMATLIAIDGKIGVKGEKKGLLSKQTLFMFDDATKDQVVQLSLSQALDAVKHRQQTVALDGLYSILGLLPYGEQATVSYENNTPEQALKELMNLARQENPFEINEDGSTKVEGFVQIKTQSEALQINKQGILL